MLLLAGRERTNSISLKVPSSGDTMKRKDGLTKATRSTFVFGVVSQAISMLSSNGETVHRISLKVCDVNLKMPSKCV